MPLVVFRVLSWKGLELSDCTWVANDVFRLVHEDIKMNADYKNIFISYPRDLSCFHDILQRAMTRKSIDHRFVY